MIALPDPRKGERIILCTERDGGDARRLTGAAKAQGVSELMFPAQVLVIDKLPLLGSGKIDYPAVAKMVAARQAEPAERTPDRTNRRLDLGIRAPKKSARFLVRCTHGMEEASHVEIIDFQPDEAAFFARRPKNTPRFRAQAARAKWLKQNGAPLADQVRASLDAGKAERDCIKDAQSLLDDAPRRPFHS